MPQSPQSAETVRLSVENIGGISDTSVTFKPGVTVLSGRNATNRTSLLRSIMAVLGSDDVSLKSDAEAGSVEMQIGSDTYSRRFVRQNGTVVSEGDPYLDDPELADLFAFLLATNETRQAVLTEQNLRERIMRPVDTTEINRQIDSLTAERDRIDDELSELSRLQQELPSLEGDRQDVLDQIEQTEAELQAKREEIAAADADLSESRADNQQLEDQMSKLGDLRSELDEVRQELRAQRESRKSLQEQLSELETDAADLPESPESEIAAISNEIEDLRDRKQSLQSEINALQQIIQFNEDNLDGTSPDLLSALADDDSSGAPTDQLLGDQETVVCWTCGNEVDRAHVEETLERLRDLRQQKSADRKDIDERISERKNERIEYEEKQRQREQVTEQLRRVREQIEAREKTIEDLTQRQASLEAQVSEVETTVSELQTQQDSTVLSLHKEANELEVTLNRLESDRQEIEEQIEEIESELDRRPQLQDRREEIATELEDLRTRIDRIEADAVESFNDHMETVLEVLEYDNLERIWIERTEREADGRGTGTEREFTLHIVRVSSDGTAYTDTISHLSESEREVTGLVFALAGYLVHDVHETVPFMLLDSLEAIDSDRIAKLIGYFESYPEYLVAALLPEDAAATPEEYAVVQDI